MQRLTDATSTAPRDQETKERDDLAAFARGWRAAQSGAEPDPSESAAFKDGFNGWHGRHFLPDIRIVVTPAWVTFSSPATAPRR